MTPDEFRTGMAVILATWPKEAPPAQTLEVYQLVTAHLDADVWLGAVKKCVMTCTFFPKPAELLQAAVSLTQAPERTGLDAWGDVKRAIAEHSSWHPPDGENRLMVTNYVWSFADPLVGKVVKAIGWINLCMSENEMADRAHFIRAYEAEQARAADEARMPMLAARVDDRLLLAGTTERQEVNAAAQLPTRSKATAREMVAKIGRTRR